MQPSTRRALRVGAIGLAVVALILGLMLATLAVQLSGGWDDVLDLSQPMPEDPDVLAARAATAERVVADLQGIATDVAVPVLAAGRVAREAGGPADPVADEPDGCVVGQHNWKVDDGFDLLCGEAASTVLAAREAAIPDQLRGLDAALQAQGWEPYGVGLADVAVTAAGGGAAGTSRTATEDLPSAEYWGADGQRLWITFRPVEATGPPVDVADGEFAMGMLLRAESFRG
ncbi:MAG: hypothetical protein MUD13_08350 [Candidatus Nanopelagicales bacterium]|jgi:hypothetical protein|nr:hypothetical protein [Candidatus Nanopelagicales bacterium]